MHSVKPLRLKRETYRNQSTTDANTVINVWVDSGISHLDGLYSYRTPIEFKDRIQVGSRVKVPFNSRSCEALVVEISQSSESLDHLKIVEAVLGDFPVATPTTIDFFSLMSSYWASDPYSLIRSGIPPRVASVEKLLVPAEMLKDGKRLKERKKLEKTFFMHTPHKSAYLELVELARTRLKFGSTLLLLPDTKDVDEIFEILTANKFLHNVIRLDSSLPRALRYENYMNALSSTNVLVVGNRSALFTPIKDLDSIIVAFEKAEQHFEKKHPYWNVRDSVFLRAQVQPLNLYFTGYVPSSKMAFHIENREVTFVSQKSSIKTFAYPQVQGELLPDRIIPAIRSSLKLGPVLFLVPRKGYANALLCAKCRNIALCDCGGRFVLTSAAADPVCSVCAIAKKDWKCNWCQSATRYVSARGIDRFHEEIGRAFPNTTIQLSSAPNILSDIAPNTKIVIATAGAVPIRKNDYAAVVLLEGQRFLAASTSVYEESVYEHFFDAVSHVRESGNVYIALDSSHPLVASISRWSPSVLIKKILRENLDAFLPPYSSVALIIMDSSEVPTMNNGITKSIKDGRLPLESKIFVVESKNEIDSKIVISVPIAQREVLASFLLELSRKRAVSKKSPISIVLDPYVL